MKKQFALILNLTFLLFILSCEQTPSEPKPPNFDSLSALKIDTPTDTLFVRTTDGERKLNLKGIFVDSYQHTSTNSGVVQQKEFTTVLYDTTYKPVDGKYAVWYSENPAIATFNNGKLAPVAHGKVSVYAKINEITSSIITVVVSYPNDPPSLNLDPPAQVLIFRNYYTITGYVQKVEKEQKFTVLYSKLNGGGLRDTIQYGSDERFSYTVQNLPEGINTVDIVAQDPLDVNLKTTRSKAIIYYQAGSADANKIVGKWKGTFKSKDFEFNVQPTTILGLPRYDITAKVNIDLVFVGIVDNINLFSVIDEDGKINLQGSVRQNGFDVSVKLTGYFENTGQATGRIEASVTRSGFPKVGFKENWTAVKVVE